MSLGGDEPDHLHHPSNVTYLKSHFPDDPALVDHLVTSNIKPVRLNMTLQSESHPDRERGRS
jgi:hypothetical protein